MRIRPSINIAEFFIYAIIYGVLTVFVAAVLFAGYKLPITFDIFGITIPAFVYVAGLAFLGFAVQYRMSASYGGGRVADAVISAPMIIVIVSAVLVWAGFPFAQTAATTVGTWIGQTIETVPTEYKVMTIILFGFFAKMDLIRDYTGWGRRSSFRWAAASVGGAGARREDLVSGAHGDLPDRTVAIDSRSGEPEYENLIHVRHRVVHTMWDPMSGRDVPISHAPTPRAAYRVAETIESRPAAPAAPVTPTEGGGS